MTVAEAAKRIGISESKLYQLVAARAIAHYRIGGKIVFSETDIESYLASCRVRAVVPTPSGSRTQLKLKHIRLG